MSLDRNAILGVQDLKTETLQPPGWPGPVTIRGLTGAQRDALEQELSKDRTGAANFHGRYAAMMICDPAGVPLFSEKDAVALGAKSAQALAMIVKAGLRLSATTDEEAKKLLGESEGAMNGASGSASP